MSLIHVLDKHTAELIAAGEVVERPSSVIKELFENAVDAGASVVNIEIEHGGVTKMFISDNGCGIHREDVPTAFLRHATSKVKSEADLNAIGTLGFRGEALASIAAVAKVEMITRAENEEMGTRYIIEGGEEQLLEDVGCSVGTTFVIENLFYNVPARMKFLKTDIGEGNAVSSVIDKLALSHPEISVSFKRDGKEILFTTGDGDLFTCIYSVLGKEFANSLIPLQYEMNGLSLKGFVSKCESGRANRSMQMFFINGRYVKTKTGAAAIEQAYRGSMMVGKYPTCVLFLTLPFGLVDVNVHPAKIEVRFANEKPIFDIVYHGCKTAIEQQKERKEIHLKNNEPEEKQEQIFLNFDNQFLQGELPIAKKNGITGVGTSLEKSLDESETQTTFSAKPVQREKNVLLDIEYVANDDVFSHREKTNINDIAFTDDAPEKKAIKYVGEIFSTYVLCEMDKSLYLIDKHAAHERILYNQLKKEEHTESQQLLEPISVSLTNEECTALLEQNQLLSKSGFEMEWFGGKEILVRSVPIVLSDENIPAIVTEIAGHFVSGKNEVQAEKLDWLYHNTACRAAVKAGNHSTEKDLKYLAEQVLLDDSIRTCPHGRPVCICLTQKEIEKQFGRIV